MIYSTSWYEYKIKQLASSYGFVDARIIDTIDLNAPHRTVF